MPFLKSHIHLACVIIFCAEMFWSYASDWAMVYMVGRRRWRAFLWNAIGTTLGYAIPWYIYVETQDWRLMIPAVLGVSTGAMLVAARRAEIEGERNTLQKSLFEGSEGK